MSRTAKAVVWSIAFVLTVLGVYVLVDASSPSALEFLEGEKPVIAVGDPLHWYKLYRFKRNYSEVVGQAERDIRAAGGLSGAKPGGERFFLQLHPYEIWIADGVVAMSTIGGGVHLAETKEGTRGRWVTVLIEGRGRRPPSTWDRIRRMFGY